MSSLLHCTMQACGRKGHIIMNALLNRSVLLAHCSCSWLIAAFGISDRPACLHRCDIIRRASLSRFRCPLAIGSASSLLSSPSQALAAGRFFSSYSCPSRPIDLLVNFFTRIRICHSINHVHIHQRSTVAIASVHIISIMEALVQFKE